jgi:hypothetical protein
MFIARAFFTLSLLVSVDANSATTIEFLSDALECNKTTEKGADEVYVVIVAQRSDGANLGGRLPGPGMHWDMNDNPKLGVNRPSGDSYRRMGSWFTATVKPGESLDVVFLVMEEDGGNTQFAQKNVGAVLLQTGNPIAAGAGAILQGLASLGFYAEDTDDFIGSFGAHVTNVDGKISVEWRPMDRVYATHPYKNGFEFDMNGDGSHYKNWMKYEVR